MKNLMLIFVFLLLPLTIFAQGVDELPTTFNGVVEFLLPAILGQLSVLFMDAKKYMSTELWSWGVFFKTKIQPFLLVTAAAIGILLLMMYAPFMEPFLEVMTGPIGEMTAFGIFGAAQALIDGFLKPKAQVSNESVQKIQAVQFQNSKVGNIK